MMEAEADTVEFQWEDESDDDGGVGGVVPDLPNEDVLRKINFVPPSPSRLRKQRKSVSAECLSPADTAMVARVIHDKSEVEKESIRSKLSANILFSALDEDQRNVVVDAVEMVPFDAGTDIIVQGDTVANTFYILESGEAKAVVNGSVVKEYTAGGAFGELALLYNAPRAATVTATTNVTCWALGRDTFRSTVIQSMHEKREAHQKFLADVPLLSSLAADERAAIADVLTQRTYEAGEEIIREGDAGNEFYLLEDGTACSTSTLNTTTLDYKRGDYFGELALLHNETRKATVTAKSRVKVLSIDMDAFTRLLGNLQHILKRNEEQYGQLARDGIIVA